MIDNIYSKYRSFCCENQYYHKSIYCKDNRYLLDILKNKRLYASNFNKLNDIEECMFLFDKTITKQDLKNILDIKMAINICSFSLKFSDDNLSEHLMWAHYANRHKGFRIDFLPIIKNDILKPVKYIPENNERYDSNYPNKDLKIINKNNINDYNTYINIMTTKKNIWKYEQEYRILSYEKYVDIEIKSIVIGKGFLDILFDYDKNGKKFDKQISNLAYELKEIVKNDIEIFVYKSRYTNDMVRIV